MQRIINIRFIFIAAVLVVAMACQQSAAPAAPPVATAKPQPTETLTAQETPAAVVATSIDAASSLPPSIQILSPAYQEAFRLLPDGEWARKLYALDFEDFDLDEWSKSDDTPNLFTPEPLELDAGDEFNLMRVLRDENAQEWVVEKVRELDAGFGERFASAETPSERLEVLKQMVTTKGVEPNVLYAELFMRWQIKITGQGDDEIARSVAWFRQGNDTSRVVLQLSAKGMPVRMNELQVCEFLIVGRCTDSGYAGRYSQRAVRRGKSCAIEQGGASTGQREDGTD